MDSYQTLESNLRSKFKGYFKVSESDDSDLTIERFWIYSDTKSDNYYILTDDESKLGQKYTVKLNKEKFPEIYHSISEKSINPTGIDLKKVGLIEGSLIRLRVKNITLGENNSNTYELEYTDSDMDLGDIEFKLDIKGQMISDGNLKVGDEIYGIIQKIKRLSNDKYQITITRKSSHLVTELLYTELAKEVSEELDIVKVSRIPNYGSRIIVKGDIGIFIPHLARIRELVANEYIQLIRYNSITPIQLMYILDEFRNTIKYVTFELNVLRNYERTNVANIYTDSDVTYKNLTSKRRLSQYKDLIGFDVNVIKGKPEIKHSETEEALMQDFNKDMNSIAIGEYFLAISRLNGGIAKSIGNVDKLQGYLSIDDKEYYTEAMSIYEIGYKEEEQ